nr:hypothetical protein Iba_chr12fCG6390 [Ipomoea batatas]
MHQLRQRGAKATTGHAPTTPQQAEADGPQRQPIATRLWATMIMLQRQPDEPRCQTARGPCPPSRLKKTSELLVHVAKQIEEASTEEWVYHVAAVSCYWHHQMSFQALEIQRACAAALEDLGLYLQFCGASSICRQTRGQILRTQQYTNPIHKGPATNGLSSILSCLAIPGNKQIRYWGQLPAKRYISLVLTTIRMLQRRDEKEQTPSLHYEMK